MSSVQGADKRGSPPSGRPQISVRQIVMLVLASGAGWIAWRNPGVVNAFLAATAVYAVADRHTLSDQRERSALRQVVLLATAGATVWFAWRYPGVVNPIVVGAALHSVVDACTTER
jgi:hypothetical protein